MVLLDTSVISELMKKTCDVIVHNWLDTIQPHQVFTCVISKAEIEFSVSIMPEGKRKNQISELSKSILSLFADRILPFDITATPLFAEIKSSRQRIGRPISYADAQIAAIAMRHNLCLSTRNTDDFQFIEGLKLINPWQLQNPQL